MFTAGEQIRGRCDARAMLKEDEVAWPVLLNCQRCTSKTNNLVKLPISNAHNTHEASVWNGDTWMKISHGTKLCKSCGTRYKLNYIASGEGRINTLTAGVIKDATIILVHTRLGFTLRYLRLLWNRICRAGTSFLAEASSIVLADSELNIGHAAKKPKGSNTGMTDDWLSRQIADAVFIFLRYQEHVYDFSIDDPVPMNDPKYGTALDDVYVIYNKPEFEHNLTGKKIKLDIVTDGCAPLARNLCDDERKGLKHLQGRPKEGKKKCVKKTRKTNGTMVRLAPQERNQRTTS